MRLVIQTRDGNTPMHGIKSILDKVLGLLNSSGDMMSKELESQTRDHFRERFPGSSHYDPSKVNARQGKSTSAGPEGAADIDVPGAGRAYHDVTIRPVKRKAITIPVHQAAYGKKPADVPGLFVYRSKNGSAFLAKSEGKELQLLWLLAKRAFQRQDSTIMPEDGSLAASIFSRISKSISEARETL